MRLYQSARREAGWDIVTTAAREHADRMHATLRQAGRGLRRTPAFTVVAILHIVSGVLLKPLPYPGPIGRGAISKLLGVRRLWTRLLQSGGSSNLG